MKIHFLLASSAVALFFTINIAQAHPTNDILEGLESEVSTSTAVKPSEALQSKLQALTLDEYPEKVENTAQTSQVAEPSDMEQEVAEATKLERLPDNLQLYILQFLDPKDVLMMGQVSKYYNRLTSDYSLWKPYLTAEEQFAASQHNITFKNMYMINPVLIIHNNLGCAVKIAFDYFAISAAPEEDNFLPIFEGGRVESHEISNDHLFLLRKSLFNKTHWEIGIKSLSLSFQLEPTDQLRQADEFIGDVKIKNGIPLYSKVTLRKEAKTSYHEGEWDADCGGMSLHKLQKGERELTQAEKDSFSSRGFFPHIVDAMYAVDEAYVQDTTINYIKSIN